MEVVVDKGLIPRTTCMTSCFDAEFSSGTAGAKSPARTNICELHPTVSKTCQLISETSKVQRSNGHATCCRQRRHPVFTP